MVLVLTAGTDDHRRRELRLRARVVDGALEIGLIDRWDENPSMVHPTVLGLVRGIAGRDVEQARLCRLRADEYVATRQAQLESMQALADALAAGGK